MFERNCIRVFHIIEPNKIDINHYSYWYQGSKTPFLLKLG
jgi:hypothetical protein